jgi:hypothetical protein
MTRKTETDPQHDPDAPAGKARAPATVTAERTAAFAGSRPALPVWDLGATGTLRRREIYGDVR